MMEIFTWVSENWDGILAVLTGAVALASAIAALTPTPSDDTVVGKLYKLIDWLALNIGRAKEPGSESGK